MRVLINTTFLVSPHLGGSWTYTFNLLRALDRYSSTVEFIVLTNSRIAAHLRQLRMEVRVVVDNPEIRSSRVSWEQLVLPGLARRFSPSVFHSTGNTLPLVMGCPMVVTMHDFQYHFFPKNFSTLRRIYLQTLVPCSLRRAATIACVSEFTKGHAMELYGIPPEKLSVIYEAGLWDGECSLATPVEHLQTKFNIDGPIILSAGSSLPHKNIERLILAYGMIKEEVPHKLVIVGEPFGYGDRIEKLIHDTIGGFKDRIRVTGFVSREDLLGLYMMADTFVFPSLFEGFGIPALEAMECGCPVVASRSTSLPEVIDTAGEFFDPTDANDIARVLKKVCSDEKLRKELRQRGFRRAEQFSWNKVADDTMRLYRRTADID